MPLVHQPAAGDDISTAVQSRSGADVGGYSQDAGPYRVAIGRRGVDDQMLLAVPDDPRLGNVDQVHARPDRVGSDGLVTQVEANAARPGTAHRRRWAESRAIG